MNEEETWISFYDFGDYDNITEFSVTIQCEAEKLEIPDSDGPVVLVIGQTGTGKSTFCNFLTGHSKEDEFFATGSNENEDSVTTALKLKKGKWRGRKEEKNFTIIDTPGLGDTRGKKHDKENMQKLVEELREVDHINAIVHVVKGTDNRNVKHLQDNLKIFKFIFGKHRMISNFINEVTFWAHYDKDENDMEEFRHKRNIKHRLLVDDQNATIETVFIDPIDALPQRQKRKKKRLYALVPRAEELQDMEVDKLKNFIWSREPFSCSQKGCRFAEGLFEDKPNPTIRSGDQYSKKEVVVGDKLELECVIATLDIGSVKLEIISWWQNGSRIQVTQMTEGVRIEGSKVDEFLYIARLSRTKVTWIDAGNYSCRYKTKKAISDLEVKVLPIIDCKWAEWSGWSDCSKTCAGGIETRYRRVLVQPENGGKECKGNTTDIEECNTNDCPHLVISSDGHYRAREVIFGEKMELTCHLYNVLANEVAPNQIEWMLNDTIFQREETNGVVVEGVNVEGSKVGDLLYEARLSKTEVKWTDAGAYSCKYKRKKATHDFKVTVLPIIDCKWEDWSDWSDCSKTCEGGIQTRRREIQVQPANGGKECNGDFKDFEVCNIDCPGKSMSI